LKAKLIKYGHLQYHDVHIEIEEVGYSFSTFGKNILKSPILPYSLHTEYSASTLNEQTINELKKYGFNYLANSFRANRADLWASKEWTKEFIDFIKFIVKNRIENKSPKIIEIHPPYIKGRDYQNSLESFFDNYRFFESKMVETYGKEIIILLENRNQTGNFLLSKSSDYIEFQKYIQKNNLKLKLIVDIPQLYGKMLRSFNRLNSYKIIEIMTNDLLKSTDVIGGFHICGKSHRGNFDDLFGINKDYFLKRLKKVTHNIEHTVYVVPEIMSQQDYNNILKDIQDYKIFDFI